MTEGQIFPPELLLLRKNHLLSLVPPLLELLLRVLPLVLFAPLDGLQLLGLDLSRLLHDLGNVPVSPDAPDLGHVALNSISFVPPLHMLSQAGLTETVRQGRVVLLGLSLPRRLDSFTLGCVGSPYANVAVVRPTEDEL